jgi:hypothetical protein
MVEQDWSLDSAPDVRLTSRGLWRDIHSLYLTYFWSWFRVNAPATLGTVVVIQITNYEVSELWRTGDKAAAGSVRFGGFFLAWFIGCFALGAVATLVGRVINGDEEAWDDEAYERARSKFWPLLSGAVLTFLCLILGFVVFLLIDGAVASALGRTRFLKFNYALSLAGIFLIGCAVSWQGLMFPMLIWTDVGAWQALKSSYTLANGYRTHLASLVIESLLASYLAGFGVYYALGFVAHRLSLNWASWPIFVAAVLASAAAEAPMFIGFSLLYWRRTAVQIATELPPESA